jgi:ABC-type transport system substrate-binding protein
MRRAASMVMDRDLMIDVLNNTEVFTAAGIAKSVFWHSHMPAQGVSWVDPKGKEMGEGAKYFQYDRAEAKKLMDAAGYDPNKKVNFWSRNRTLQPSQLADITVAMLEEGGFGLTHEVLDNNTTWRQQCQQYEPAGTAFDGFCYVNSECLQ